MDAVPESEPGAVQDLGETDVAHRRRHAGITGFVVTVSENGSGYGGSVQASIDPQVFRLAGPSAEAEQVEAQRKVGPANALPVRRDVGVVDVESGIHDADRD